MMESSEVPGGDGPAARVLVVAHKTAATQPLLDAVRERASRGPAQFTLLVPNPAHGLHRVVDPEDQDTKEAQAVIDEAIPRLTGAAGSPVEGIVGSTDPHVADRGRGQPAGLRRGHHLNALATALALAEARPSQQDLRAGAARHDGHAGGLLAAETRCRAP